MHLNGRLLRPRPEEWSADADEVAKVDLPTVSIASQAAIGGPGSALALGMAMKWHRLVAPGVIIGIFGYALGNYLGFFCAYVVRSLVG